MVCSAQAVGVVKEFAEQLDGGEARSGDGLIAGDVGVGESVSAGDRVGKVGVDFKMLDIANHEQGRIFERILVEQKLAEGRDSILMLACAFVLHGKVAAIPYVGIAARIVGRPGFGRQIDRQRDCLGVDFGFASPFRRWCERRSFGYAFLVGKLLARLVHVSRLGVAHQIADVVKMSDVRGGLFEVRIGPVRNELFGCHTGVCVAQFAKLRYRRTP